MDKIITHRFLSHEIKPYTETLILGTFNPESEKNDANSFIVEVEIICGNY